MGIFAQCAKMLEQDLDFNFDLEEYERLTWRNIIVKRSEEKEESDVLTDLVSPPACAADFFFDCQISLYKMCID